MSEQQTNTTDWLDEEIKGLKINHEFGDVLPALKLEAGTVVNFIVDFAKPFPKWNDPTNKGTIKAIIPVYHKGEKKNLWLNVKNPLYGQLCEAGKRGESAFKVSTTGTQKDTRYTIVRED